MRDLPPKRPPNKLREGWPPEPCWGRFGGNALNRALFTAESAPNNVRGKGGDPQAVSEGWFVGNALNCVRFTAETTLPIRPGGAVLEVTPSIERDIPLNRPSNRAWGVCVGGCGGGGGGPSRLGVPF